MEPDGHLPLLASGRFVGRRDFQQCIRDAIQTAAIQGWKELVLCDASFDDWPLGEINVVQYLQDWSKAGRRLVMMARSYQAVEREMPRFVRWRQTWDHLIDCRIDRQGDRHHFLSALWSPFWAMHRIERERCTFLCGDQPLERLRVRQSIDEIVKKSTPGFPATRLGL